MSHPNGNGAPSWAARLTPTTPAAGFGAGIFAGLAFSAGLFAWRIRQHKCTECDTRLWAAPVAITTTRCVDCRAAKPFAFQNPLALDFIIPRRWISDVDAEWVDTMQQLPEMQKLMAGEQNVKEWFTKKLHQLGDKAQEASQNAQRDLNSSSSTSSSSSSVDGPKKISVSSNNQ